MQNFKLNAMKIKKEQFSDRMKAVVLLLALACVNGYAQENNSSKGEDGSTSKEEGNRNVMLNAASANGPVGYHTKEIIDKLGLDYDELEGKGVFK